MYSEMHQRILSESPLEYYEFNQESRVPEVSVIVTCYNHADYIADCLKSILDQETSFTYEVLVGDDSSSDNSLQICVDIALQHKVPVRIFKWSEDSKSFFNGRPSGNNNFLRLYSRARATICAKCDGDDLWVSKKKLQIQFDFLQNPDYALVFGKSLVGRSLKASVVGEHFLGDFSTSDLQWNNITGLTSSTSMWRDPDKADYLKLRLGEFRASPYGDWLDQLLILRTGKKGYVLNETLGFYRQHEDGFYSSQKAERKLLQTYLAFSLQERFFPAFKSGEAFDKWIAPKTTEAVINILQNNPENIFKSIDRRSKVALIIQLCKSLFVRNK